MTWKENPPLSWGVQQFMGILTTARVSSIHRLWGKLPELVRCTHWLVYTLLRLFLDSKISLSLLWQNTAIRNSPQEQRLRAKDLWLSTDGNMHSSEWNLGYCIWREAWLSVADKRNQKQNHHSHPPQGDNRDGSINSHLTSQCMLSRVGEVKPYAGIDENDPHGLRHWIRWSLVGGAVWEGGMDFLEDGL